MYVFFLNININPKRFFRFFFPHVPYYFKKLNGMNCFGIKKSNKNTKKNNNFSASQQPKHKILFNRA